MTPSAPTCPFCLARLSNGSAYCDDECRDGFLMIHPHLCQPDEPEELEEPAPGNPRPDEFRPCLAAPPEPKECIDLADVPYLNRDRLRAHLLELNP
jgi:hypothetical protein